MPTRPNILLLNPPRTVSNEEKIHHRMPVLPPLGLMCIAGELEKNGFSCEIINCLVEEFDNPKPFDDKFRLGLSDEQIAFLIKERQPDIVGISVPLSIMKNDSLNIARIIKDIDKEIIVVFGGVHTSLFPKEILNKDYVDFIIVGEGELSFTSLIKKISIKGISGLTQHDLNSIPGLGYKINSKVFFNAPSRINDINILFMPAYHLVDMEPYWKIRQPMSDVKKYKWVTYFFSRGCPYACTFCSAEVLWGRKYRVKSADKVLEEIELLMKSGFEEIHFIDDNVFLNKERTKKILKGIIKNYGSISWCCANGIAVNTIDEEIVKLMVQSGCFSAQISIESGNQYVLDNIAKKPLKLNKVKEVAALLRKYKLHTKGFFMIGFPGETKEQLQDTINFIKSLKLDWIALNIVTPLPGTELYKMCREMGVLKKDFTFDDLRFLQQHMEYQDFSKGYLVKLWHDLNREINFENNVNLAEGNYDFAIYDFKRVIEFYPGHKFAHYYLAKAYEGKGDTEQAQKHYAIHNKLNGKC